MFRSQNSISLRRPSHFLTAVLASLSLVSVTLTSCEKSTEPEDGGSGPKTVALSEISDMPMLGGKFTDVEVLDNGIVTILDGKLMLYDLNFENGQLINGDVTHDAFGAKDAEHVYAITSDKQIRTYDLASKTFTSSPYSIQYNLSDVEFRFNSKNDPYIVITHGSSRGVVYYSKDKGQSWLVLKAPPISPASYDIAFGTNDEPLVISPSGVYRTTDDGESWTLLTASQPNFQGLKGISTSDGSIYVFVKGSGGFMKSVDGGATFTASTPDPTFNLIDLQQGDDGALYALVALGAVGYNYEIAMSELKRSTDGGATWKHLLFCNSNGFGIRNGKIAVINGGMFSSAMNISQGGAFISGDNGATWQSRGTSTVENVQSMAISNTGDLYLIAEFTVYKRVGSSWQTYGMNRGRFGNIAIGKDNKIFLASTSTSDLFDPTEGTIVRGSFNYPVSLGDAGILGARALRNGGYLVPIGFYYSGYYSSGVIVRVDANGAVLPNGTTSYGLQNVVEDPDGVLYGSATFQSGLSQQYYNEGYTSADGGITWTLSPTQAFAPLAFSNTQVLQFKSGSLQIGPYADVEGKPLTLEGWTFANERPIKYYLTADNKLYVLSLNVATSKTRVLYTAQALS